MTLPMAKIMKNTKCGAVVALLTAGFVSLSTAAVAEGVGFSAADVPAQYTSGAQFLNSQNSWDQNGQHRFSWDGDRFGLSMNIDDPKVREGTQSDVSAGAYFRITPSVKLGGEVKLGAREDERVTTPIEREPSVRFETAFEF